MFKIIILSQIGADRYQKFIFVWKTEPKNIMNLFVGSIGFALSYCDFHSRTLWHTTLHTWSTFLIVKKPDDITVLKEEKILCIVFFMTFLKYSFPGPLIRATQNFQGILNFFCHSKANIF